MAQFAVYWSHFNREPEIEFWHGAPGEDAAPPPFMHTLKLHQMVQCGKSREAALATPLNEAIWDYIGWGVNEGKVRLKTRVEAMAVLRVKEMKRRLDRDPAQEAQ